MTVVELDPPRTLRLVASQGERSRRTSRYRNAATLGRAARIVHRGVLADALQKGCPVDPDALRVVLAAKQARDPGAIGRFTANAVWQLLFVDIVNWCRNRRLAVPAGTTAALRATVAWLDETGALAPGSDSAAELAAAVDECTGGWDDAQGSTPTQRKKSLRSGREPNHP